MEAFETLLFFFFLVRFPFSSVHLLYTWSQSASARLSGECYLIGTARRSALSLPALLSPSVLPLHPLGKKKKNEIGFYWHPQPGLLFEASTANVFLVYSPQEGRKRDRARRLWGAGGMIRAITRGIQRELTHEEKQGRSSLMKNDLLSPVNIITFSPAPPSIHYIPEVTCTVTGGIMKYENRLCFADRVPLKNGL